MLRVVFPLITGGVWADRECNICGYRGAFYPAGFPSGSAIRLDAGCPSCGALERQRFFKLWVDEHDHEIRNKSVLHFAPEACVRLYVEPVAGKYVSADINDHRATDLHLDIEQIDLADCSFDVAICSHILEHVDDAKALSELCRILKPGGLLLAMVPMIDAWDATYENKDVKTPQERRVEYGQSDHVRYYGADVKDRIAAAEFAVTSVVASGPSVSRFGLIPGDRIFVCKKKASVRLNAAA